MQYIRITETLADFGMLVPKGDVQQYISTYDKDWYRSVFLYNEDHYKTFKAKGTISGIVDVTTNNLYWDFDSKDDLEQSRQDTVEVVARLIAHGVPSDAINVCFSGNKGFSVDLNTTSSFTPKEVKSICVGLANGLSTFDPKMYNASRIFRIPYTKNMATGLYKIPLTVNQLSELPIEEIKRLAHDLSNGADWSNAVVDVPSDLKALINKKPEKADSEVLIMPDLDLSLKPRGISACKFAILNGFFTPGNRSHCLMALGAHLKSQGNPKEITYRMLKGAAELQGRRYNQEPFAKEEIWNNIISQIYGPNWKGATYSCAEHEWLKEICPNKGRCSAKTRDTFVTIDTVSDVFGQYAANIDKNTIKTGIKVIDDKIRLQTHSHAVIAACSGAGKTTTILNILNNTSNAGLKSVMGSMDMSSPLVYQKLAQKVTGLSDNELYKIYQQKDKKKIQEIRDRIAQEYEHVLFDFRSGVDINELRENLLDLKYKHGSELKLVVYDFINRIRGPYSEETANLSYIAPRLADLANETETLIISLAQVARAKGGPSTPLTDSRVAKGSSAIEESATVLFGMWRPGYNKGDDDKFLRLAALKTRMGKEFSVGLHWNGMTGDIRELSPDEELQLEYLENKDEESKDDGWGS